MFNNTTQESRGTAESDGSTLGELHANHRLFSLFSYTHFVLGIYSDYKIAVEDIGNQIVSR